MDRLEIAVALYPWVLNEMEDVDEGIDEALKRADKFLARERETRPKCGHKRTAIFSPEPYNLEADYTQCLDCGAEVTP
jgi:hypothetical protein